MPSQYSDTELSSCCHSPPVCFIMSVCSGPSACHHPLSFIPQDMMETFGADLGYGRSWSVKASLSQEERTCLGWLWAAVPQLPSSQEECTCLGWLWAAVPQLSAVRVVLMCTLMTLQGLLA